MNLGEMRLEDIKVGLKVQSSATNNFGTVTEVDHNYRKPASTDIIHQRGWITITWSHGGKTSFPHWEDDWPEKWQRVIVVEENPITFMVEENDAVQSES